MLHLIGACALIALFIASTIVAFGYSASLGLMLSLFGLGCCVLAITDEETYR